MTSPASIRMNRHAVLRPRRYESEGSRLVQAILAAFLIAVVICAWFQFRDLTRNGVVRALEDAAEIRP